MANFRGSGVRPAIGQRAAENRSFRDTHHIAARRFWQKYSGRRIAWGRAMRRMELVILIAVTIVLISALLIAFVH